jgi:hypothetical protein
MRHRGEVVILTTHDQRRKARNLQRDPRASLTVFAAADPPGSHRLIGRLSPERVTGFAT